LAALSSAFFASRKEKSEAEREKSKSVFLGKFFNGKEQSDFKINKLILKANILMLIIFYLTD
jgi:hypothetical protein